MRTTDKAKKSKWTSLRTDCTGEPFGNYYKIRCLINGERHELQVFATSIKLENGDLVLYKEAEPYRAFAKGQWQDFSSISCLDGSEIYEDRDYVEEVA